MTDTKKDHFWRNVVLTIVLTVTVNNPIIANLVLIIMVSEIFRKYYYEDLKKMIDRILTNRKETPNA